MKKVLMVSFIPTHPQNEGNKVRIYNLVENMKELGVDIYFLYISEGNTEADIPSMQEYIGKEKLFIYNYNRYKKFFNVKFITKRIIRKLLQIIGLGKKVVIHYKVDEAYPKLLNRYIKKLNDIYHFDVAWVEYVMYSKALEVFNDKTFKVIDTHDIFANRERVYLENNEVPVWRYTTKKEENKGLSRSNCVIAIQNDEEQYFSNELDKSIKVVTIGNSIKIEKPEVVKNKNYIFVGSNNELNKYSIEYFIKNILPKVKEMDTDANFIIVGGICKSIPDSERYTKLGYVEDLSKVYKEARLVINPIRTGTGLNIKTIEALGYSKPLITTSCGAKGLKYANKIFEIANDDDEFANKIVQLLNNDNEVIQLSKNAYEFVNNYNNEVKKKIKEILNY